MSSETKIQSPILMVKPGQFSILLASGSESQVFKYKDSAWEKVGQAIPYTNFDGELAIDKNESFGYQILMDYPALLLNLHYLLHLSILARPMKRDR